MKLVSNLLALCLALTTVACEPSQLGPDAGSTPKIAADVRTQASAAEFVAVIIHLDLGADPEAMSRDVRARAIEVASDRVIAQVPPDQMVVAHRYRIVPILSAWVRAEGVEALAVARDGVMQVVLDRPFEVALDNSTDVIDADEVWPDSIGERRLVAILDTGIHSYHPFVQGRVPYEACFRVDGRCPGGPLGTTYEKVGPGAAQTVARRHGPHVAGIAAGANGSFGSRRFNGVAPGANIIAIDIFSYNGKAHVADQIKALEYVEELRWRNVPVVAANLSLEDRRPHAAACDFDPELKGLKIIIDKLFALGVATVIAAGNEGFDDAVAAPGCISSAVTVSSVGDNDGLFKESNRSELTDLLAPGETILSSRSHGGIYDARLDYMEMTGTSMAAPHVSGAIALLSAAKPSASIGEIINALEVTGKVVWGMKPVRKYRRIDLDAALAKLRQP